MPIRVAAVEVSHWHAVFDAAYLYHLAAMPEVELVAVQDSRREIAEKRAAAVGNPPVFTDYHRMLDEVRPDFVMALGRHIDMAEIANYLLDAGYPFLMEKPMGPTAEAVRGVADKAKALNGFAAASLPQRYSPFARLAKRMVEEGRFGTISHIYSRTNRPQPARFVNWDSPWMADPHLAAGGSLRNLGPHGLDLFNYLTGEDAEVTAAQFSSRVSGAHGEDYATLLLRSASGIIGTVEVGNTYPQEAGTDGEQKIAGSDAILALKDGTIRLLTRDGDETMSGVSEEPGSLTLIRDTLAHWQRGEPPPASVEDCYKVARLIDQAYDFAGQPYR